tara:strand:- start:8729 stop:8962 length:234 start_codon:yes stop_codon:yes gene_type:complete
MPDDLHQRLVNATGPGSLNATIVAALEEKFPETIDVSAAWEEIHKIQLDILAEDSPTKRKSLVEKLDDWVKIIALKD